ncbi:hypothetical protein J7E25_13890 [Agromyces sp. ISL-38]|uniref:hypothetical protein n=1 Tax=Agromyces sp. ISL-38 TaxID=2819107 RepID=UPI001BE60190|nr:hypothetical protein [Agromyces sp. ISL-38]MBT2500180.1 hypothetical protein [Agromyces sp. ISL-38]
MTRPKTDTERADRRAASEAVDEAKRAAKETRKLAKTLSRDAGASLAAIETSARAELREAKSEIDARPRRAERTARKVAARLEDASMRMTPYAERALAEADAKRRAKTIKRHRAQAKQVQKMAKFVALHAIVASVVTPTEEEQRKADEKRRRRPSGAEMDARGVLPVSRKRAKSR